MTDWLARYFDLATHVAQWSKDPSTKVGAVVVGADRTQIALGYNGFPRGIGDLPERLADRETKYVLTQHAERNVLDNARFDLRGATLVVTAHPCAECAKSIVSRGITRVVCPPPPEESADRPWTMSCGSAHWIMTEARVEVVRPAAATPAGDGRLEYPIYPIYQVPTPAGPFALAMDRELQKAIGFQLEYLGSQVGVTREITNSSKYSRLETDDELRARINQVCASGLVR